MTIPLPDIKQLWGRAASKCSICRVELDGVKENGSALIYGINAHIVAESENGPRGKSILSLEERNSYFNLILLCPTCHDQIDKDPERYPIERLHMFKARHELRVRDEMGLMRFGIEAQTENSLNVTAITVFIERWAEFLEFYVELHCFLEYKLLRESDTLLEKDTMDKAREWHKWRRELRELLFRADESKLCIKQVPDWERLKESNTYCQRYLSPFSFVLDFGNPIAMVNIHGKEVWAAVHISHEFVDLLSYKHSEVKAVWSE